MANIHKSSSRAVVLVILSRCLDNLSFISICLHGMVFFIMKKRKIWDMVKVNRQTLFFVKKKKNLFFTNSSTDKAWKAFFPNLLGRHIYIDIVTVGVYEILPKPPKKKMKKRRRRKLIVHTGRWIKKKFFAPLSMLPIKYLLRNSFFHRACAQQHETIKSLRQAWQCGYTKAALMYLWFFFLLLVMKKKFSFNAETNSVLFCIDDD